MPYSELFHDIRPDFVRTALISGSNYPLQLDAAKRIIIAYNYRCCKDANFFEEKAGSLDIYLYLCSE